MNKQISFQNFYKLESIVFCMSQLRGNKRYNVIPKRIVSTQKNYLYRLWNFHYWLVGLEFSYDFMVPINESKFRKHSKNITLDGLENFLELYDSVPKESKRYFTQIIKKYLKDPIHENKKS